MFVCTTKLNNFLDNPSELPTIENLTKSNNETVQDIVGMGWLTEMLTASLLKDRYQIGFSYPLITVELIDVISKYVGDQYVLELGSGSGYLAHNLELRGVNIMTVDTDDWDFDNQFRKTDIVGSYRQLDVSEYNVFIMSWPNYGSPAAAELINNMKSGDKLIYCGESANGCTGTPHLYKMFDREWSPDSSVVFPYLRFKGLHDYWRVYIKN